MSVDPAKTRQTAASTPLEIRVRGIAKAFEGHGVLTDISLDIHRGDLVAIVGGSGCGKTVLLNHILGLLSPDVGSIDVADHAQAGAPLVGLAGLDEAAIDEIHMHWGVVFQRNALFSGTVFDNIALWLRETQNRSDDEISAVAKAVLSAVALPSDHEFLGTPVDSLSGGMAKRLAVARALSMKPMVMFYDEPTTGLDPTSAAQIQDLVLQTHQTTVTETSETRTTVIITHDKDLLARLNPRVVMLHDGCIYFDGPFAEFAALASPITRPYFDLMPVLHQPKG